MLAAGAAPLLTGIKPLPPGRFTLGATKLSLKLKVAAYVAVTLTAMLLLFAVLVVRQEREELLSAAAGHVNLLSDVIVRSTRFAMLNNRPDYVHRIIQDVALQERIDRVRIFSKEGTIIDSTLSSEVGQKVDRKSEGCSNCHQSERPLESVPLKERSRTFVTPEGKRMLASMEVIRNEPSCYNAACHAHSRDQAVLGVLGVGDRLVGPLHDLPGVPGHAQVVVDERVGLPRRVAAHVRHRGPLPRRSPGLRGLAVLGPLSGRASSRQVARRDRQPRTHNR